MPTDSQYQPLSIPPVDLWAFLFERTDRKYPDDHVLLMDISAKRKHTFQELRRTTIELGRGLRRKWKWQKGDIMVVFSPNSADVATITFGTHWAGGIVCPANNLYTVGELVSLLKSSGAKALTTHLVCLEVAREAALIAGLPLDRIVLIGDPDPKGNTQHFSALRDSTSSIQKASIKPKHDLAFLVYSSGTTGLPKGVMLSHENIVANILQNNTPEVTAATNWKKDSIISFLPMFHIYGIACSLFIPLYQGITMHIMQRFDLEQFCQSIQVNRITIAYIVPPVAVLLAKHPLIDKHDLSSLRMMHSAAAPLSHDLIMSVHTRLKVGIVQSYGMSESSPAISTQRWADWNSPTGSVGKPLPSMSIKIMEMNGNNEVPIGQEGEIWMKGPNVFEGYYKNLKATSEAFVDGWFRSGDCGYIDEKNNLFLTDRYKEIIKYNGFQVAPAQLEGLLLGHPAVSDVAVIGIYSSERATELPRAYVVIADGHIAGTELEKDISDWLHQKVAPYKRLRGGIRFIDEVPKSAAGKVLRRVLVEHAKKEEAEQQVISKL